MRTSKSHDDKLIDIDDEPAIRPQRAVTQQGPPPGKAPRAAKATPAAREMWELLQGKKGLVTISDFISLCEKPSASRFIQVAGEDDRNFQGYHTANEMLENMGVDTRKVGAFCVDLSLEACG